jgi:hypothetical protein
MLRRVALVRTDFSEELRASFIRVTRIGELGRRLGVTSNRRTLPSSAQPLITIFSLSEILNAIAKLNMYNSPGIGQFPGELLQAVNKVLVYIFHKVINSIWNKEELSDQWRSVTLTIQNKGR